MGGSRSGIFEIMARDFPLPRRVTVDNGARIMMSDTGPSDHEPTSVNVSEPWTLAYWARRLEVPIEQIEDAVKAVGHEPAKVAAHLGKPWPFQASGIV